MVLYNPPHGIRVLKPAEPEWAFHVCRYPVEAPKPWERAIWLPAPLPDASAKGMFARQALFLPGPSGGTVWPILEPDIDPTVAGLWVEMAGTPLTIPLIAEQERRFEEDWRTKAVCNPSGVWLPFEPSSHSRLG